MLNIMSTFFCSVGYWTKGLINGSASKYWNLFWINGTKINVVKQKLNNEREPVAPKAQFVEAKIIPIITGLATLVEFGLTKIIQANPGSIKELFARRVNPSQQTAW